MEPVQGIVDGCRPAPSSTPSPNSPRTSSRTASPWPGGGSLLRGPHQRSSRRPPGLPTKLADDPLTCVARGTCIYLEHLEEWKSTLENDMEG
jgi:rod shape-determining protein MreB